MPRFLPALLLAALSLAFLAPTVGRFSSLLDEGLVLSLADRLVQGEWPYRDFYLFTTPLPVLGMGAVFALFGTSLNVAHWALVGLKTALVLTLYAISRELLPRRWAWGPPAAALCLYMGEPMNYYNHWIPNLPYLLTVWAGLALVRKPGPGRAGLLGLGVVVTGLTLQTFGVAVLPVAVLAAWETGDGRCRKALALSLSLGVLAGLGVLTSLGLLGQFLQDTIGSNLARSGLEHVSLGGFLRTLWSLHGPLATWPEALRGGLLVATHLLGLLGPLGAWRTSPALRIALVGAWMMLLACSYRLLPSQLLLHGWLPLVLTAWVLVCSGRVGAPLAAALAAGFALLGASDYRQALEARFPVAFPRGTARVASAQEARELAALVAFLARRTPTGKAFFIPYEPNLYFLLGLKNPTRYLQMRPLQYTRAQMQEVLPQLRDCPVFRFPAYESDAFLRWGWPDLDLRPYREQERWFHEQLLKTHRWKDHGAVQVYLPLVTHFMDSL